MRGIGKLLCVWALLIFPVSAESNSWAERLNGAKIHGVAQGMTRAEVVALLGSPPLNDKHLGSEEVWRYGGSPDTQANEFFVYFDLTNECVRGIGARSLEFDDGTQLNPQSIEQIQEMLGPETTSWQSGQADETLDYLWEFGSLRFRVQVNSQGKAWRYIVARKRE